MNGMVIADEAGGGSRDCRRGVFCGGEIRVVICTRRDNDKSFLRSKKVLFYQLQS